MWFFCTSGSPYADFDAPQRQQCAALDAEIALDPRKYRLVLSQRLLASDDPPVRDAAVDVLPDLFAELRLVAHLLETLMSGSIRPITRVHVASEMPLGHRAARGICRAIASKPAGAAARAGKGRSTPSRRGIAACRVG